MTTSKDPPIQPRRLGVIDWGKLDSVVAAGVMSLGAILGAMGYAVFTANSNLRTVITIVSLFGGAVIAGIFQTIAGTKAALPREVWLYPVGLLVGIYFAHFVFLAPKRLRQSQEENAKINEKYQEEQRRKREEEAEATKDLLFYHLKNKVVNGRHINMIDFDTLWSDLRIFPETATSLIARYPSVLCHRTLASGKRGIGLAGEEPVE
jgi:hypothetical protein